jgi:[acyl-carrier-protein] S-malonyltransferase
MMNSKLAFLFPGQGSQSKGMLDAYAETHDGIVSTTLSEASEALGYDMAALIRDDADEKLNLTEYTQPALLAASVAILRVWRAEGGTEAAQVAGHSLGEYSALVAAGSLDFIDAVQLVAFRGRAMSEAVPADVGLMVAILGLEDAVMADICEQASTEDEKAWAANLNCPGQLVIAGHRPAVERAMAAAAQAGAKRTMPLAVSAPSHTPLMRPAAERMRERLQQVVLRDPDRPVWSNARAVALDQAGEIREALIDQLVMPVRWTEIIQGMRERGIVHGIEMGPGKVLAGLVRRIEREIGVGTTAAPEQLAKSQADLAAGEGQ